jgi:eukaryotic-like serine/threonine-protein kinase
MKVLREINRGGFGRVEEVETPAGERLARKVFDPLPEVIRSSPSGIDKLKKRFEREAKTQASLDTDYFIPILDMSLEGNAPWFTMPMADRSLRDELLASRTDRTIPTSAFADILNSLEQLHALGFVHRDLKPENVLLHDGQWKLSDFGLVLPPVSGTSRLSSIGSAWGTAAYAAPEQASDFRSVTFAADIYRLGAYFMIFSKRNREFPIRTFQQRDQSVVLSRSVPSLNRLTGSKIFPH